ncbi:MAG: M15 family metallopeptidase [Niabella sp.]
MKAIVFSILFFGVSIQYTMAQKPPMLKTMSAYKESVVKNSAKKMIEVKSAIPNIIYDLRYAATNNFMKRAMYPKGTNITFLRKDVAAALAGVQYQLNKQGLGLKIFDAYRPWSVSKKFWKLIKDERYVANPAKGSNHNRGTAVDLTIINIKTEQELDMGTDFDNFTDTAHHSFTALSSNVLQNRLLLKQIMEQNGFVAYNDEWWHYTFKSTIKFEVLDIAFKKLEDKSTKSSK